MIRLTSALANCDGDRTLLMNPLHMVTVGPVSTEAWDASPEGQQRFEHIQQMFPGAKSEIAFPTGRSVWVMESPAEVWERLSEWFTETERLHRHVERSVS